MLVSVAATPGGTATAFTDGYARALVIGAIILLAAAVVAGLAIPPLRRTRATPVPSGPTSESELEPSAEVIPLQTTAAELESA